MEQEGETGRVKQGSEGNIRMIVGLVTVKNNIVLIPKDFLSHLRHESENLPGNLREKHVSLGSHSPSVKASLWIEVNSIAFPFGVCVSTSGLSWVFLSLGI